MEMLVNSFQKSYFHDSLAICLFSYNYVNEFCLLYNSVGIECHVEDQYRMKIYGGGSINISISGLLM